MPEDFNEVVLSQAQIDNLIWDERCRLYFESKDIQKRMLKEQLREEMGRPFTPETLERYILSQNPHFKLDKESTPLFKMLCLYFTGDKQFETMGAGFSLDKGLAIVGVPGCGKTELLRLFQFNKVMGYHLTSINQINLSCMEAIEKYKTYCGYVPGWVNLQKYFFRPVVGWAIDDIGLEDMVNDYGNKAFMFSKIIQDRYLNKHNIPFNSLHITTMLTPDQIGDKYGLFIRSRFREMFNYIVYEGEDRRK